MLDAAQINDNLQQEIEAIANEISGRMLGQNLPFVADALLSDTEGFLGVINDLMEAIDKALASSETLEVAELAELLNQIELDGQVSPLTVKENGPGQLVVFVELEDLIGFDGLDLDAGASIGLSAGVFDVSGDVAADVTVNTNFALILDLATADVELDADQYDQEVTLQINGEIDFDIEAEASLGFIDVSLSDLEPFDVNAPKDDLVIELGLDLKSGGDPTTLSLDGRATLDFEFMAGAPDIRILPEFGANVFVEVTYSDADLLEGSPAEGTFAIELRDVVLKLEALSGVLQDVFSTVSDILNTFPIGEIVDLLVKRLPVVDDLAPSAFDFDEDGKITLQDVITLISVASPNGPPPAFGLIQGVILLAEVIDAVDELATGLAEDGCFDIGTLRLTSDALDTITSGASFSESAQLISSEDSDLQNLADLVEAFGAFNQYIGLDEGPAAAPIAASTSSLLATSVIASAEEEGGPFDLPEIGLSFPFLSSPEALVNSLGSLILNGAGAPAVSLVEFDLPPLEFDVYDEISIRFGPFVGYLFGTFYAGVDINIGYDTAGFGENFDFLEGLYISPDLPEVTIDGETKTPVGTVSLGVGVGGGLDIVIARVAVEGGLLGTIDVFLGGTGPGDNKARLSELGGCFFNDISGRITAGIDLVFKFGFGIFSFTKKQSLASVTLAQFNIDPCNPVPDEIMDQLEVADAGLAADQGDGTLLLHVGAEADQRGLSDEADAEFDSNGNRIGRAETETFFVGVVPEDEDHPAQAGEVAVFAFGIFQRFGNGEVALQRIVGAGGSEDDVLTVSASVNLDADLSGGAGDDVIVGGGGDDFLRGDTGNDQLDGDLGDDELRGGSGNDILRGGAGADVIDGGAGFDQVDFSQSQQGVTLIESAATPGLMIGFGGEATGDLVRNVEHFIGSGFDDTFYGNRNEANVFEAGAGDDVLVGGIDGDLFIGGTGADVMRGNRAGEANTGGDAASYVFSTGGVFINLAFGFGTGGDAQGDVFYGIEDFQLSRLSDRFIGDDADNLVDGYDGDDELEGGAGRDTVLGGVGDDIVYALGDGDTLNGGGFLNYRPDTDELSYEKAGGSVIASLYTGIGFRLSSPILQDSIAFAEYIGFNADGENTILSRGGLDSTRTSSFENLTGSDFDDSLTGDDRANEIRGGTGADNLDGEGGNDLLIGGSGADVIDGGSGSDTADYRDSDAAVQVNLTAGILGAGGDAAGDQFVAVENLVGSRYEDTLTGNSADNRLDPYLNFFNATETLIGNGGIDTAVLNYASDNSGATYGVFLNQTGSGFVSRTSLGNPVPQSVGSLNTIEQIEFFGTSGADGVTTLIDGNDVINTGGGADNIFSFSGNDRVDAGTGNDSVYRLGEDTVQSDLYEGAEDDLRETFILDGGRGIDSVFADISYTDQNIVWVNQAPGTTESNRSLTLEGGGVIRNFETLIGLVTGTGNDIVGQLGTVNNIFSTGVGSDTVIVGLGNDTADGGGNEISLPTVPLFAEVDTLVVDYSGQNGQVVTVDTLTGNDAAYDGIIRLQTPNSITQVTLAQVRHKDFERIILTGTSFDDHLVGSDKFYNQLSADTPGDILIGGLGNDLIQGLAGDDTLRGGEGIDRLEGGDGEDILIGADRGGLLDDRDVLFGGAGADRFIIGDAEGLLYDGQEDGAAILDFSTAEGDVIQLSGDADDYRIEVLDPIILSDRSVFPTFVYVTDPDTGSERLLLTIVADVSLSLTDDAFEYVASAAPGTITFSSATVLSDDVASSPELTSWLWQSGAIDDETFLQALQDDSGDASNDDALAEIAALQVSAASENSVIRETDVTEEAHAYISDAISDFAAPLFENDNFTLFASIEITGDAAASGVFFDMFGHKQGIVLSTGRVDEILGENTEDGRFTQGPRPASQQVLDFENLGALEGGTLYRALIPDVPGGIQSLALQDDNDLVGGASGFFTAFDLDALFFSTEFIDDLSGLSRADVNAVSKLDVIEYSAAGITLEPGTQRPGGIQSIDLAGTANGLIDFDHASLDTLDWNGASNNTATGFMSFGEGGTVSLNLDSAVNSSADAPTYLYIYEIGGQENLEGLARVSAEQIGTEGDLSTDLGAPGIEGDATKLTATFFVDYSGKQGPVPEFTQFTNIPFFDVVIVSEELPERGGADLPDLVSVRVNGVDVLLDSTGATVTMNTLALSPYGDYAPELSLNLVGEGALSDVLRADSYTTTYRVSGPVINGANTIEIEVADRSDAFLDTAVFISPIEGGLPLNTDPVARNDSMFIEQNQSGTINLITGDGIDTDADSDTLTITSMQLVDAFGKVLQNVALNETTALLEGGLGKVTLAEDGTFTFDSTDNFDGLAADTFSAVSFAYTVSDGNGGEDSASVMVAVSGVNDAPIARNDFGSTDAQTVLDVNVLANDSDVDGDDLTVTLSSKETLGTVSVTAEGVIVYDPNGAFADLPIGETTSVSFDYSVSDGEFEDTATVTIEITGTFDETMVTGTPGDDTLEGSENDDVIIGLGGNDTMTGLGGNDLIQGNAGKDEQDGGAGDDRLEGGLDDDALDGGAGDDMLLGQAGDDVLNGASGFDFASFEGSTERVVASLNTGTATGEGTDTLSNIEGLIGTGFNDRLTGDAGENTLFGGDGDDVLIGLGGPDTLYGEDGNDSLIGSGGDDALFGGDGDDEIDGRGGADLLVGEAGNDTITGDVGLDEIDGGSGNDDIFGNFGADLISGGADNDNIRAGGSGDVIDGGTGNDRIVGGNGRDTVWGSAGNDTLFGGEGNGNGDGLRDVFVFKSAANGGGGFDIIRDFEDTTDKLDLSESGYTSFADVLADATQVGANVEINFDFSGLLRINNLDLADLTAGDFIF